MANPSAFVFPDDYDPNHCALLPIPIAMVGFVWGALEPLQQRQRWQTEDDWRQGYAAIASLGACMMAGCMDELIESNNRVYRLLDTIFRGAQYTVSGDGTPQSPYVYNPPMPLVPERINGAEPSMLFYQAKVMRLIDNLTNATTYTDAPDTRNIRQLLQELLVAMQASDDLDPEMLAKLGEIALAVV